MIKFCGTKINLGLRILRKREDGYHDIETVFYPLPYGDVLEAINSKEDSFDFSGLEIGVSLTDNLVWKAYNEMKQHYDISPMSFHLHKIVPPGTGLGGGSADAAAMIYLINKVSNLRLSKQEMIIHAKKLGADCAFFIHNKPLFAKEKGDVFEDINVDLSNYKICLVLPKLSINTAMAYKNCIPNNNEMSLKHVVDSPISSWKGNLFNDFENVSIIPQSILDIKSQLYKKGAIYASMSGSGSAVFGIFPNNCKEFNLKKLETIWC